MDSSKESLKETLYDSCKVLREFFVGYDMEFVALTNALFRLMRDESTQPELAEHIRSQLMFLRGNLWEANRRMAEMAQQMEVTLPPFRISPALIRSDAEFLTEALERLNRSFEQFRRHLKILQQKMEGKA